MPRIGDLVYSCDMQLCKNYFPCLCLFVCAWVICRNVPKNALLLEAKICITSENIMKIYLWKYYKALSLKIFWIFTLVNISTFEDFFFSNVFFSNVPNEHVAALWRSLTSLFYKNIGLKIFWIFTIVNISTLEDFFDF